MTAEMILIKETKNTYVYSSSKDVPNMYVSKSAFTGDAPKKIKVTIEPAE